MASIESIQMQCPPNSPTDVQLARIIHEGNAIYLRAVLYTAEARSCSLSWTVEDLPRSSYSSKSPPSPAEVKKTLYRNAFDRYTQLHERLSALKSHNLGTTAGDAKTMSKRLVVLAPLAFEAILFMTSAETEAGRPVDEVSLIQVVEQTMRLQPEYKTYSIFADLILSAVSTTSPQETQENDATYSRVPVHVATNLLAKLIEALRDHPEYDVPQASRWIRCVVQVILDHHVAPPPLTLSENSSNVADRDRASLETLKAITDQALTLARSSVASAAASSLDRQISNSDHRHPHPGIYPPDELEWLAATLFNLCIDLFVSLSSLGAGESDTPHQGYEHRHTLSGRDMGRDEMQVLQPQFWAGKAIEIADVLVSDGHAERTTGAKGTEPQSDGGLLATILRDRSRSLGWEF